jgi:cytidylate kinase
MIITIDGPAASGKSSVAKALAKKLGYYYLYTGLLYRAVAYILTQEQHKMTLPLTEESVKNITDRDLAFVSSLVYKYQDAIPHVFFNDKEITSALYATMYDQAASLVSAHKPVRDALLEFQRSVAKKHDVIADGRDCGTVVFPHAEVKFFLTADIDIRAKRMMHDTTRLHKSVTLKEIKAELAERDTRDKKRKIAPLEVPKDAVFIDNSQMDFEQTVELFLKEIDKCQHENVKPCSS